MQQAVLADGGESLLFDRRGSQVDTLEHAGVEDVEAGVDAVTDELDGLLDEAVDARGMVGFVDDDAVLGGFVDLGHDNGALVTVRLVELCELFERVLADDIRVQHEEGGVVFAQDLLCQLQWSGRSKRFCLDGEVDSHVVLFFVLE